MSASGYYVAIGFQTDRAGLLIIQKIRTKRVDIVSFEINCSFWRALIRLFALTPLAKVTGNQ